MYKLYIVKVTVGYFDLGDYTDSRFLCKPLILYLHLFETHQLSFPLQMFALHQNYISDYRPAHYFVNLR